MNKQLVNYFAQEAALCQFMYKSNIASAYKFYTVQSNRWACDNCLAGNLAIGADFTQQTFCIWQPHMAYVDQMRKCRNCDSDFVFSRYEQKYWYETLGFWVVSDAVNCKTCRKEKRIRKAQIAQAQKEIVEFLPSFDKSKADHLERIIQLYGLTESNNKVSQYKVMLNKLNLAL